MEPAKSANTPTGKPQSTNIWQQLPEHFLALAPMEGVTDVVFRQVIARAGRPDLFFTEFTNVSSYASAQGRANALERLEIAPTDPPIIAQIWGKNPEHFAQTAGALAELGFSGLDINMGCPDRHVNRAGGGAAMITTPDLAVECIRQAQAATPLPVSVKTRLGYTYVDEYTTWLPLLLQQNLAALTVHLRTRKEMSKVPAHFELIPKILRLRTELAPQTKLIINGDIRDATHAAALWQQYPAVDGMMIGRGVFANPFCFRRDNDSLDHEGDDSAGHAGEGATAFSEEYKRSAALEKSSDFSRRVTLEEKAVVPSPETVKPSPAAHRAALLDLLRYHLDLHDARAEQLIARGSRYPFEPLKHFFKIYINNFPGASDLRARLMECKNTAEVRQILDFDV